MVEQKSRINACAGGMELMPYRWTDRMKTPHLDRIHWRKSSQWFSLIRKHVQTVVEDEEVSER
jgi:predicted ATP-grasp superfamily ATP-dependent carboligase